MANSITSKSPCFKAGLAGAFYLLAVLTAVAGEFLARGRLAIALGLVGVACFIAVTLLVYDIFHTVSKRLALLATVLSLVGLAFEAARFNPSGVDVAIVLHGLYCLLIGYLTLRSNSLPRILGLLMSFAGLAWIISASPLLGAHLSLVNQAVGFVGEGSLMLWFVLVGTHAPQREPASASGALR